MKPTRSANSKESLDKPSMTLTLEEREAIIEACRRNQACAPEFSRLTRMKTDKGFIQVLADNLDWCNRKKIPIPTRVLETFIKSKDEFVRKNVANSPLATVPMLEQLSTDDDSLIRMYVAQNPNATPELLEMLSHDLNTDVRRAAASNPNTPIATLEKLSKDGSEWVRLIASRSRNATPNILEALSSDKDWAIRLSVAEHPNTPVDVIRKLEKDKAFLVARAAMHRMQWDKFVYCQPK